MADTKITALTALTAADPINDVIPIVDISDTTMAASGTTKKISVNNILSSSPTASGALTVTGLVTAGSATITGDLTVDTSTLKVDSGNNRVIVGHTSGASPFQVSNAGGAGFEVQPTGVNSAPAILSYNRSTSAWIQLTYGALSHVWQNSGTDAMTLNSTSNLVLKGGTAAANGVGLTFPATQVASSDANCLDDYEEGTWTPVFQGTSSNGTYVYSTQVGRYTKVGNLVTVFGHLVISSITTPATGVMRIGGLPFTTSSANVYAAATVGWVDLITISSGTLALSVNTGGVVIDMYRILSGAGVGFINPSDLVVNTRINFTATYFV